MPRRRTIAGFILLVAIAVVLALYLRPGTGTGTCTANPAMELKMVSGNGHSVVAEVAREEADKVQGLSGRTCLDEDRGMLFTYDLTGDYCFWMRDMRFPLDMLWLDDEKKVVTVKDTVGPETFPQSFCPERPAQYILEINAGQAKAFGWQPGTTLEF